MTIDIQLSDMGHGLLGGPPLATANQSELPMGVGCANPSLPEQPLSATLSPAGSLQDEDMDTFKVRGCLCHRLHHYLLQDYLDPAVHWGFSKQLFFELHTSSPLSSSPTSEECAARPPHVRPLPWLDAPPSHSLSVGGFRPRSGETAGLCGRAGPTAGG